MISDSRRRLPKNTFIICMFNKPQLSLVFSARDIQCGKGYSLLKLYYLEAA